MLPLRQCDDSAAAKKTTAENNSFGTKSVVTEIQDKTSGLHRLGRMCWRHAAARGRI
ncbi:hypothetical protein GJA_4422 [Janthinobacterium agaricidamnosum NBRC 102515 = DSM 9628]|uniref:Uncharacterized protein n=1 Tax=Janthinobacterium agaricidamnosum NBRC 102515 = DSM 9628 TaxID=1349767 RepID=W0V886_9BURK|nr:hypothetical protein GJA_4422 [Janthinobacterium agaricidamnosum NBRC 102515 = DSM 9628]